MVEESASTTNDTTPSRIQPTWLALLGFGLTTRLIVVVLGCFVSLPESSVKSRVVHSPHNDGMNLRHLAALSSGSRRWIEPWYRWDAMWPGEKGDSHQIDRRDIHSRSGLRKPSGTDTIVD